MKKKMTKAELINKFQLAPLYFINDILGNSFWEKQELIANYLRDYKRVAVKSCHGVGKTFTAARLALWFLYSFPHAKVITTAPTFRQVEAILWREMRKAHNNSLYELGGKLLQTSLDISEDWFAMGLSTDEADRIQGFHAIYLLLIIDEASGVKQEIFDASEGLLSSEKTKVLLLGNPISIEGEFYKAFKMPNYKTIKIDAFNTPNFTAFGITLEDIRNNTWSEKITGSLPAPYLITPEWVYDKYLRWGEQSPMWTSRVLGEFPEQGTDTLIPLAWIEFARNNAIEVKDIDPEQIGADIARFGDDSTEYIYRKGPATFEGQTARDMDIMSNAGKLNIFSNSHPLSFVAIDAIGLGGGVYDREVQLNPNTDRFYAINVAEKATDTEQFVNLRAEVFWDLRSRFMEKRIDLTRLPQIYFEELAAQLSAIKYKFVTGRIQIESKEDMKKRGLPSPDKADALALAYMNLKTKSSLLEYMSQLKQA